MSLFFSYQTLKNFQKKRWVLNHIVCRSLLRAVSFTKHKTIAECSCIWEVPWFSTSSPMFQSPATDEGRTRSNSWVSDSENQTRSDYVFRILSACLYNIINLHQHIHWWRFLELVDLIKWKTILIWLKFNNIFWCWIY